MTFIALLAAAQLTAASQAVLTLEKVRSIEDPRIYDLDDPVKGDRGVPAACVFADGTKVTLDKNVDATIAVVRDGKKKTVVVKNVRGVSHSTLVCGEADYFYFVNPRDGHVYAYSANRLLLGEDPVVWTRRVEPFKSMDEVNLVMAEASVATVLQTRQRLVLVEWFFRKDGDTGFWHEVFDGATGASLGRVGPSDLLVKTNDNDPWWILFQGGGNDLVNYVPKQLYRLRYGPSAEGARPAAEVLDALRSQQPPQRVKAVAKLSANPVINHMIALLTPSRSADSAKIEFCPLTPPRRAKYWLGEDYDETLGGLARNILLAFSVELQGGNTMGNPIDVWFQTEIVPTEPMKTLAAHFNSQDDQWIAAYQKALLDLGGPEFDRLFAKYGKATDAVIWIPEGKDAR